MLTVVAVLPYRAAVCGDGGLAGLQKQFHPEVHGILFRRFYLWQFGELTVQNVRLHNGRHEP